MAKEKSSRYMATARVRAALSGGIVSNFREAVQIFACTHPCALVVARRVTSGRAGADLSQWPRHGDLFVGRGGGRGLANAQRLHLAHHLVSTAVVEMGGGGGGLSRD